MKKQRLVIIIFSLFIISCTASLFLLNGNADENNASVFEVRKQAEKGNIAIVAYNGTSGITFSTGNGTYTENSSNGELQLDYSVNDGIDSYLRKGEDGIYLTGTYDNTALVFYVRETESEFNRLQLEIKGVDEKMYFASIGSEQSPDISTTVRVGITDNFSPQWLDMLSGCTSSAAQYCTVDYTMCPYDSEKNAYQVVIRVDDGMACFSKIELTGLELVNIKGDETDIQYVNGSLADTHNPQKNACYMDIKTLMMSDIIFNENNNTGSLIRNFLLRFYDFILEITTLLRSFFTLQG